jgi:hypothetical protein
MSFRDQESIQLLNTAIIKSKEKKVDCSYEDRLSSICKDDAITALGVAANYLSEKLNISRDQAAMQLIETIRDLDKIWNDYIIMEGISKLKKLLKDQQE